MSPLANEERALGGHLTFATVARSASEVTTNTSSFATQSSSSVQLRGGEQEAGVYPSILSVCDRIYRIEQAVARRFASFLLLKSTGKRKYDGPSGEELGKCAERP